MRKRTAFTLIELSVTIALIGILLSLLCSTVSRALAQSRLTRCVANEQRICEALQMYSMDNGWQLPPNTTANGGMYWYDVSRVGGYFSHAGVPVGQPGGPAMTCPEDDSGAHLSYAMNVWGSCKVDASVTSYKPPTGALWTQSAQNASKLILIAEAYSWSGSNAMGWYSTGAIGFAGSTAGQKFGGGSGITPALSKGRFGKVVSELCFMRHRVAGCSAKYTQPRGTINIGYADGHVETKTDRQLVTAMGNSSGDSLWCSSDVVGP